MLPYVKMFPVVWVIKTVWYQWLNRQIDLWNRKGYSERQNSSKYGQLIFYKGAKAIQWRKGILFNNWCQSNGTSSVGNSRQTNEHKHTHQQKTKQNKI